MAELIEALVDLGLDIELFTIRPSKIRGVKKHHLYDSEQHSDIYRPLYESMPIELAHLQFAVDRIQQDGRFDIVHDHTGFSGAAILKYAAQIPGFPPVLQTLHGPPFSRRKTSDNGVPSNKPYWSQFRDCRRLYFTAISRAMAKTAPKGLASCIIGTVHNAVNVDDFRFVDKKQAYFLTLARFGKEKGQHVAAELCFKLGYRLKMAGTIAGITTRRQLQLELTNPLSDFRRSEDFRYYSDNILPITAASSKIQYIGSISGRRKLSTIANAKALLFPIDWEEPFGLAVIEALACGTPVVAMNRGAMPEIIEHGVNGFLASNRREFEHYLKRVGEISPADCRQSVIDKFSSRKMAEGYIDIYRKILATK